MYEILASPGWRLPRLPVGDWFDSLVTWLQDNLGRFFDFVTLVLESAVDGVTAALTALPPLAMIVVFAVLALWLSGWKLALFTLLGFALIDSMDEFNPAMQTLGQVILAAAISVVIAIPIGIWAARNDTVSAAVRPVLDFLQTLPAFVYLIPVIFLFSIGVVPGLIATVIFSLPPGVRLTELGIRQVDKEMVEAGEAFGCPPGRILTGIQIPLAMPSIMAGINQIIMLSLSMVVIAGMVGAPGLGAEVFSAVTRIQLGPGFEAGIGVVVLAIFLDRLTASLRGRSSRKRHLAPTQRPASSPEPATSSSAD